VTPLKGIHTRTVGNILTHTKLAIFLYGLCYKLASPLDVSLLLLYFFDRYSYINSNSRERGIEFKPGRDKPCSDDVVLVCGSMGGATTWALAPLPPRSVVLVSLSSSDELCSSFDLFHRSPCVIRCPTRSRFPNIHYIHSRWFRRLSHSSLGAPQEAR